jgi:hypothetical protein
MHRLAGLACVLLISGCMWPDGGELGEFTPYPPDDFQFVAETTLFFPPGSQTYAEGRRLSWLDQNVRMNGMCRYGYALLSREVIFEYQSTLIAPTDNIVYRGRCLPPPPPPLPQVVGQAPVACAEVETAKCIGR